MPDYKYNNQATSQAIASISAWATSVILETGKWALFPSTYPFQVLIQQYNSSWVVTAQEIASCTNRSGDTLTITRANEAIPNTPSSTTQAQVARSFDVWIGIIQVTNTTTSAVFTEVVNSVKKSGPENIDGSKTFTSEIQWLLTDNWYNWIRWKTNSKNIGSITFFWPSWSQAFRQDSVEITSWTWIKITLRPWDQDCITVLPNLNVGILTTNPTEKLDVNGNVKVSW